jgi:hypothetical protein
MNFVHCVHCRSRHTDRYLCDPAKMLLDSMIERGRAFDMPTLTFEGGPVEDPNIGGPGDVLLAQLVIKASVIPVEGVNHPAVLLTGRSADGSVLPHWIHVNTDAQLRASATVLRDMTELAIRQAT